MITSLIRLITFSCFPIDIIKNNMVVNVITVYMGGQYLSLIHI